MIFAFGSAASSVRTFSRKASCGLLGSAAFSAASGVHCSTCVAARARLHEADRHSDRRLERADEIITHAGQVVVDLFGIEQVPENLARYGVGRFERVISRDLEDAHRRVDRFGLGLRNIRGRHQREHDVGLTGDQPDIADHHVLDEHGVRPAGSAQFQRSGGVHRRQGDFPLTLGVRLCAGLLRRERNVHLRTGGSRSPHLDGLPALDHHVVAEHRGEVQFLRVEHAGNEQTKEKNETEDRAHKEVGMTLRVRVVSTPANPSLAARGADDRAAREPNTGISPAGRARPSARPNRTGRG